jgi:hypothetical protein
MTQQTSLYVMLPGLVVLASQLVEVHFLYSPARV